MVVSFSIKKPEKNPPVEMGWQGVPVKEPMTTLRLWAWKWNSRMSPTSAVVLTGLKKGALAVERMGIVLAVVKLG